MIGLAFAIIIGTVGAILEERGIIGSEYAVKGSLILGLVFGMSFAFTLLALTKSRNVGQNEFDERQKLTRGVACRWACIVFGAELFVLILFDELEIVIPADDSIIYAIAFFIGIVVLVGYNIFHDAYFALNEKKPVIIGALIVITAFNGVVGVVNLLSGKAFVDGWLKFEAVNLVCAIALLIILMCIAIKYLAERRGEDEE